MLTMVDSRLSPRRRKRKRRKRKRRRKRARSSMVLQLFPFTFFPFVHDFAFIILLYLIPPDSSPHLASPSLGYSSSRYSSAFRDVSSHLLYAYLQPVFRISRQEALYGFLEHYRDVWVFEPHNAESPSHPGKKSSSSTDPCHTTRPQL